MPLRTSSTVVSNASWGGSAECLRNLYKALRTSFWSVRYCSVRWHCTVTLIALAAICFLASLFFLYVLLQWMREARRTADALKKVASKHVVVTARKTGAQRGQK